MPSRLQHDLKRLGELAFHRREWGEYAIVRYHEIRGGKGAAAVQALDVLYRWMFVPITLWPFNVQEIFVSGLARASAGKSPDKEMRLLLEILPTSARSAPDSSPGCTPSRR